MIREYEGIYIINYKKNGVLRVKRTTWKLLAFGYKFFNYPRAIKKIGLGINELDCTELTKFEVIKKILKGKI